MLDFEINNHQYQCPNSWDELSPEQYLFVVQKIIEYTQGKLSVAELRVAVLCYFLGIKPKKKSGSMFYENIYFLSRQLTFMFKIEYQDKDQYSFFDRDTQKMLERFLPEDLPPTPEIEMAMQMKCNFVVDVNFGKNLLPEAGGAKGYEFDTKSGFLSTDINAETYVNSMMLYTAYLESKQKAHLKMLAETLYPEGKDFSSLELSAILLNFQAIQSFLYNSKYGILWQRKSVSKQNKLSVGLSDTIYNLVSEGYGSHKEVKDMNLVTYLELLLKQLIDSVKLLKSYELSLVEISEKTGLNIETINRII